MIINRHAVGIDRDSSKKDKGQGRINDDMMVSRSMGGCGTGVGEEGVLGVEQENTMK